MLAIGPEANGQGNFHAAAVELDSVVRASETATADTLLAAEQVQEIAWALREEGADPRICDELNRRAAEIYVACSYQHLTGQRIRKVIETLDYLEERINAVVAACGLDAAFPALEGDAKQSIHVERIAAPEMKSESLVPIEQAETDDDFLLREFAIGGDPRETGQVASIESFAGGELEPDGLNHRRSNGRARDIQEDAGMPMPHSNDQTIRPASHRVRQRTSAKPFVNAHPLAAIAALSYEEKIALFS
jgi:hypothetical protein